jgi:RHS repeat-associated protein
MVANQTPTTNNGTTHYVWNIFGQIIAEANGSTGVTLRETIYLESMPLAAVDVVASPKKTYAVHVDHLNRPIMLTDAAKVNVWWASYEPFGKLRATGGTLTQNLGLPGQWFQLESGLAHNWHRHYDPTTGRYTTADPLGFVDGPSVFAYAGNAPHRAVDPTGLLTAGGPGKNFTPRPQNDVEQCSSLTKRCQRVKDRCVQECVGTTPMGPEPFNFFICINRCMGQNGCPNVNGF